VLKDLDLLKEPGLSRECEKGSFLKGEVKDDGGDQLVLRPNRRSV